MTILFWTHQKSANCNIPSCNLQATFRWDEGPFITRLCAAHSYEFHLSARPLVSTLLVLEVS